MNYKDKLDKILCENNKNRVIYQVEVDNKIISKSLRIDTAMNRILSFLPKKPEIFTNPLDDMDDEFGIQKKISFIKMVIYNTSHGNEYITMLIDKKDGTIIEMSRVSIKSEEQPLGSYEITYDNLNITNKQVFKVAISDIIKNHLYRAL